MNQSNYQQYGYNRYDRQSSVGGVQNAGLIERVLGPRISMKLKNPLFATASLLFVGSVFASIIVLSYPDDSKPKSDVPLIRAEKTALKEVAENQGNIDIPFRDSTVFSTVRNGMLDESAPIENLLDQKKQVDRFASFEKNAESILDSDIVKDVSKTDNENSVIQDNSEHVVNVASVDPVIIKKVEKTSGKKIADAYIGQQQRPQKLHAPASSPETLAFVRSVLEKKDSKNVNQVSADELANIETSSGAALGIDIQPGSYFVQLGSVTSASGAEGEWNKLRKKYSEYLKNVSHRVQRADLGERGIYHRIQAGPMSKDSANRICGSIKAQKPGGCLVVR